MIKNKIKTAAIATAFTILCTVPVFANKTEKNQVLSMPTKNFLNLPV